jgi:hypothetical protein
MLTVTEGDNFLSGYATGSIENKNLARRGSPVVAGGDRGVGREPAQEVRG